MERNGKGTGSADAKSGSVPTAWGLILGRNVRIRIWSCVGVDGESPTCRRIVEFVCTGYMYVRLLRKVLN